MSDGQTSDAFGSGAGGKPEGLGKGKPMAKAPPEAVIGKQAHRGRLNKRLILGVVAAIVVGMLVLNFLPAGGKKKGGADNADAVYANDSMPQDVKEMAMKLPEVKLTSATAAPESRYGQAATVSNRFAGYPSTSSGPSTSEKPSGVQGASAAGRDYQRAAQADARLEAETAARRAPMEVATKLTASLTVGTSAQGAGGSASGDAPAAGGVPVVAAGQAQYVPSTAVPQTTYTPGEIYRDLNDQKTKVAFTQQAAQAQAPAMNVGRPSEATLIPYTIFAGTIIPAVLETAINTDLPGDVLASVAENVFDSVSGKNLLIPQGSKLLASYSSDISFGQKRVQVAWQRLIRPDGVSLQMANMNGVDPQGASGYTGFVDEHWWQYAKGIGLMALFSIIDGQLQYSVKSANTQGLTDVANSLTQGIDQVGTQFTSNAMNVQPTIIVPQGAKVQVFVNSDIIMPLANQKTVSRKYTISKGEGGSK